MLLSDNCAAAPPRKTKTNHFLAAVAVSDAVFTAAAANTPFAPSTICSPF
jgi:hypothetical protein